MSATPDELGKRLGPRMAWAPKSPAARLAAFACATVLGVIGLVAFFQRGEPGEPFAVAPIRVRPVLPPAAPVDMAAAPAAAIEPRPRRLAPAPDPRLVEQTAYGALPRRAEDGSRPAKVYARPAEKGAQPRIAILVTGLGIADGLTAEAVEKLPSDVTLAFGPYGDRLEKAAASARQHGHEVLLQVPMEPFDYPDNDPGPHTLTAGATTRDNLDRLRWAMGRFTGYVGVVNGMGARLAGDAAAMRPILAEIGERGLLFLDDGTLNGSAAAAANADTPVARADAVLDAALAPDAFERELKRLEETARARGFALGTASLRSLAVDGIARWAQTLEGRGFRLVPVSAAYEAAGVAQR